MITSSFWSPAGPPRRCPPKRTPSAVMSCSPTAPGSPRRWPRSLRADGGEVVTVQAGAVVRRGPRRLHHRPRLGRRPRRARPAAGRERPRRRGRPPPPRPGAAARTAGPSCRWPGCWTPSATTATTAPGSSSSRGAARRSPRGSTPTRPRRPRRRCRSSATRSTRPSTAGAWTWTPARAPPVTPSALAAELRRTSPDVLAAYRNGRRHVREFVPAAEAKAAQRPECAPAAPT